jgi:hypothetical protein
MPYHYLTGPAVENFAAGNIAFLSDTVKYALLGSSFTPNYGTLEFFNQITGQITGTGYTAGGATLASKTLATVEAASVSSWGATTTYQLGDIVRPTVSTGRIYRAVTGGTSGSSQPTWPTILGQTVTDGSVIWEYVGDRYIRLDAASPSWGPSATFNTAPRWGICYVAGATPGTDDFVIAVGDFGSEVPLADGTFTVEFNTTGIVRNFQAAA